MAPGGVSGEFAYDCPTASILIDSEGAQYWCSIGYIADMQAATEFRFKIANGRCDFVAERKRSLKEVRRPYRLNL